MKTIPTPDSHHLAAAQGWLDLGNATEANEELKRISLEWRFHPDVLLARWEVYARGGHWEFAYTIAHGMVALVPNEPAGWLKRSISLHHLKRTPEAWQSLLPAAKKFPQNFTVAYDLARYACQLGKYSDAFRWLERAKQVADPHTVKQMARKDPELEPLWEQSAK
jgi:thioredoxin-like negative regulator of GroEL